MTKRQERKLLKVILINLSISILMVLLRLPVGVGSFILGLSIGLSTRIK
jgi:hypothetical protein